MLLFILFLGVPEFDGESGNEVLIEELQELSRKPIEINSAGELDFLKLYWVSPTLAHSIIKTREQMGGFKTIDDVLKVPGMSDELFNTIQPYITLEVPNKSATQFAGLMMPCASFEFRARGQQGLPIEQSSNLGSPLKLYERVKIGMPKIKGVMIVEKDEYEPSYTDFMSGGIAIRVNDRFPNLLLGDYKIEAGEGLIFGYAPVITFKTQGVIKNRERGVQLYTNTGENNFLRGVCGEIGINRYIRNYIFFSDAKLDSKVEYSTVSANYIYDADHSTESSVANKDRIRERLVGARLEYKREVKIGVTGYNTTHYLESNERGAPLGRYSILGTDLALHFKKIECFGEIARYDENYAWVLGGEYKTKEIKLGVLSRYYPSEFFSFHSSPWSDGARLAEKGNYIYIGYKGLKNTKLIAYFDYFTRLQDLITRSTEYSCELEHLFTKYLTFTGRYYYEDAEETKCQKIRVQVDASINNINLRVRGEKIYEAPESHFPLGRDFRFATTGELIYGDIGVKIFRALQVSARLILFASELQEFRMYEYEQDLPGVMRNQIISGIGRRFYLLIQDKINAFCMLSGKYEITANEVQGSSNPAKDEIIQQYSIQIDVEL
ncbi:MAG: helix-hairpin-helix domain-containing protein [Candidatus Stahlbacteria bacterium]|nr:helix-hairpin-helix domain-containing protein [Candidatus Stahlbacteria bacterium]